MRDSRTNYGMRHINWVLVVVEGSSARAEAHGIGHRLPCTMSVTMAAAAALARDGVPLLVSRGSARPAVAVP